MRTKISVSVLAFCAAVIGPVPAAAWDYPGHRIVGAIADLVLQQHYPATQKRVSDLLETKLPNGLFQRRSLREVAVFPDCAKKNNEPYCGRPPSDEEKDYASRNRHHDTYHYTDVPLQQTKYAAGTAGTEDTDVVQMIGYSAAQLSGKTPTKTDVKLTDTEAVWLLAHLVGDIHQPLHVGAKYFDQSCETSVDPNVVGGGPPKFGIGTTVMPTVGGNLIHLVAPAPAVPVALNLHFYWDGPSVFAAMRTAGLAGPEQDFAKLLATAPPAGWESVGPPQNWAAQWATEILPLAREAHDRLTIRKSTKPVPFTGGCTWETALDAKYQEFAEQYARTQLAKAGFRLAALFKAIFEP
ncbi:MAG TPA: S1/P1 nuclease [Xanthobacteraceae bacterium]|nr:S1/P1 nuclease [Xanthobacteraceae bacterium]